MFINPYTNVLTIPKYRFSYIYIFIVIYLKRFSRLCVSDWYNFHFQEIVIFTTSGNALPNMCWSFPNTLRRTATWPKSRLGLQANEWPNSLLTQDVPPLTLRLVGLLTSGFDSRDLSSLQVFLVVIPTWIDLLDQIQLLKSI